MKRKQDTCANSGALCSGPPATDPSFLHTLPAGGRSERVRACESAGEGEGVRVREREGVRVRQRVRVCVCGRG